MTDDLITTKEFNRRYARNRRIFAAMEARNPSRAFGGDVFTESEKQELDAMMPGVRAYEKARRQGNLPDQADDQTQATSEADADRRYRELKRREHEVAKRETAVRANTTANAAGPKRSRHPAMSKDAAEAQATQEWNNDANLRERFSSKESYVSIRARELTGEFRVSGSGSVRTG